MDEESRVEVGRRLGERTSDDLLAILRRHDLNEWQPEVFDLARGLLLDRGIDVDAALASPRFPPDSPEADEDLEVIGTFATVVDAEPCRSAMTAAGFDVFLLDENALAVDPALWPALGGARMAVPSSQAEEAREFLAAANSGGLSSGPEVAIYCSSCGSSRVRSVAKGNYVCDRCGTSTPQTESSTRGEEQ